MRWVKTILIGAIALFAVLIGILFTIHNTQTVSIDLVLVQLPEASLSIWLLASFGLGALLGVGLSFFAVLVLRGRLRKAQRQVRNSGQELDKLRTKSLVRTS